MREVPVIEFNNCLMRHLWYLPNFRELLILATCDERKRNLNDGLSLFQSEFLPIPKVIQINSLNPSNVCQQKSFQDYNVLGAPEGPDEGRIV